MIDLRDANSASALISAFPSSRFEGYRLILGCERAFHANGLVRVLHNDGILLNDHVVDVSTPILLHGSALRTERDSQRHFALSVAQFETILRISGGVNPAVEFPGQGQMHQHVGWRTFDPH